MAYKLFNHRAVLHAFGLSKRLCSIVAPKTGIPIEPEYLKFLKPSVPVYDKINIQIKGFDFTIIEHYAKHVHKIALVMKMEVNDAWATPHQALHITNKEPNSSEIAYNHYLQLYERNIQIAQFSAYSTSIFFEMIQSFLPAGVSVSVHPHELAHNEIRYIPDFELIELKKEYSELQTSLDPNKDSEVSDANSFSKSKK